MNYELPNDDQVQTSIQPSYERKLKVSERMCRPVRILMAQGDGNSQGGPPTLRKRVRIMKNYLKEKNRENGTREMKKQ